MLTPSTVLLSLHPQHAQKILSGEKRLEFRRVWAKKPVATVVIYATVPVQRIVAIADVRKVHEGSASRLWALAKEIGGGLSRRALYDYLKGRKTGFAIELINVRKCDPALDPSLLINSFRPPQSFQYLSTMQRDSILRGARGGDRGKVIFVAGVHGVGKTTLCKAVAQKEGVLHKSAGEIIRERDAAALSSSTKSVGDINRTQRLLVEGVDQIRRGGRNLLLDGHFALINGLGEVEAIARNVFQALALDGIILIHDSPLEIYNRLVARDANPLTLAELTELQSVEVATAETIAKALALPLIMVKSADEAGVVRAFSDILGVSKSINYGYAKNNVESCV
jgi:predicted transcriptional regulator/adenylate kinase